MSKPLVIVPSAITIRGIISNTITVIAMRQRHAGNQEIRADYLVP